MDSSVDRTRGRAEIRQHLKCREPNVSRFSFDGESIMGWMSSLLPTPRMMAPDACAQGWVCIAARSMTARTAKGC